MLWGRLAPTTGSQPLAETLPWANLDAEFPQPLELDLARNRLARRNVIDLCLGRLGPVGSLTEESYAGSEQRSGAQQIDSQLANRSLPWSECL